MDAMTSRELTAAFDLVGERQRDYEQAEQALADATAKITKRAGEIWRGFGRVTTWRYHSVELSNVDREKGTCHFNIIDNYDGRYESGFSLTFDQIADPERAIQEEQERKAAEAQARADAKRAADAEAFRKKIAELQADGEIGSIDELISRMWGETAAAASGGEQK